MPPREAESHKGDFGRVLVIGGSKGMLGAPALTARAAFRCGAGLVRMALPESIQQVTAAMVPCATSIALPKNNAVNVILNAVENSDVVAMGPGMGCGKGEREIVEKVIGSCKVPLVIDADGLNNLAGVGAVGLGSNVVLTPHPGEMKRLWGSYFREGMPESRIEQAAQLARRCGGIVVLKGFQTVVTDGEKYYVNQTGNAGMATGGTGDVLTGCIAGLLGNKGGGLGVLESAILGTYIHGLAGDMARDELTEISLMATDVVDYLPRAWAKMRATDRTI